MGDEKYYLELAVAVSRGKGHYSPMRRAWAGWPPAQARVLACALGSFDPRSEPLEALVERLLRLQVILGTVLVLLVAALGGSLFGARTGPIAGTVAAAHPTGADLGRSMLR